MHYYGDCYNHLCLPGSGCITETIQRCPAQPDAGSATCHPLSITKSPVPRWQSCPQPFTYVCPQLSASQAALLSCQPYLQKCVVLYPESCETTKLLPCRKPSVKLSTLQSFQPCETNPPVKKRVAKSLPPCAPRCPEPSKLKFPPCGIRSSSSSCKVGCRSQKISSCSAQRCSSGLQSLQGLTSGYSQPLRGVTECPPQQCTAQSFLGEYVKGFPHQKCMKGYPTQEYFTTYSSQPCLTKSPPRPQPLKCSPGQGTKERSSQQPAAKSSLAQEGAKHKSCSAQHLAKSKSLQPRAAQHSAQPQGAAAKRSGHKKSRCTSRWLW
ncbi:uncharacterized protein LOC128980125 [Indicator indicator]|uniref:uncharacterized protein LOC128980125 n=1 Tax=Indicator indicator TaxID=1002788 RepID=UPI0023E0006C|nr:uncharacterized protein LOC128980125 [Indicator indicator]